MKKTMCIALFSLFVLATAACAGPEKAITADEAAVILKEAIPNAKVINVGPSPVEGLWEVMLQVGNKKGVVYIDSSKKYIVSGAIIDAKSKKNITAERFAEMNKVDFSKIPLDDAVVMGDPGAKFRAVIFTDPDCPYCAKMHAEMKKVVEKRKDIVFFVKMLPLPMHPDAGWKAKSIICKKSVKLLEDNFAKKKIEKVECDTKAVEANTQLASELGINGTPAMVLQDGRVMPGYKEADALIKIITGA
jgi:thiol:disulfide interchange protein DsbC